MVPEYQFVLRYDTAVESVWLILAAENKYFLGLFYLFTFFFCFSMWMLTSIHPFKRVPFLLVGIHPYIPKWIKHMQEKQGSFGGHDLENKK